MSRPPRPILDIRVVGDDRAAVAPSALRWQDAVAAAVDDFRPFAIEEPATGCIRVYFASESTRDAARTAVAAAVGPRVRVSATSVADTDWVARSQADLRAIRVGRVVVAPPWDRPSGPPAGTDVMVEIRPALGFGTGHHPSTRLALLGLQQIELRDRDVLDLGTGSGILAVAAIKLGARRATGIDRDPDALASARDSVAVNDVTSWVELHDEDVSGLASRRPGSVPVVVANLTGAVLISLAPVLATVVEAGGHMVLGGILTTEADAVARAYRAHAHLVWRAVENEWVGMVWERTSEETGDRSQESE